MIRYYFTVFLEIVCPEKRAFSTPDFSTLGFSTMNSSTPDPYGVEKFMVEWSGVEKSGVEMSCYLLEFGHFNPRPFYHNFFNPIGVFSY